MAIILYLIVLQAQELQIFMVQVVQHDYAHNKCDFGNIVAEQKGQFVRQGKEGWCRDNLIVAPRAFFSRNY